MAVQARRWEAGQERVTPLELFFDLIFVFALTQVTGFVADDPTWAGLVKGLLLLGVLWWSWAAYAWLTNTINPDEGAVRLVMFAAMGATLIASRAVPDAFGDDAFLFACAYAFVRIAHLVLYALVGRGDRELLVAVARLAVGSAIGISLLFVAAGLDGRAQVAVWALALAIDLLGAYVGGGKGWRLSAGHFAERHGLIVIIALGESIVAIGVGAPTLDAGVIAASAARPRRRRRALVGVLRRGRAGCGAAAPRDDGRRTAQDGPRLVQLPPPADGRGRHPLRGRRQEDDGARRRPARDGPGGRALRRRRALPRRAHPLSAPERRALSTGSDSS